MIGLLAATATEILFGTAATALGTKVAIDSVKNNGSKSYHEAKIAEIAEKKAEKATKEREDKQKAEERASQDLACTLIRNQKAFGGLKEVFSIFSK